MLLFCLLSIYLTQASDLSLGDGKCHEGKLLGTGSDGRKVYEYGDGSSEYVVKVFSTRGRHKRDRDAEAELSAQIIETSQEHDRVAPGLKTLQDYLLLPSQSCETNIPRSSSGLIMAKGYSLSRTHVTSLPMFAVKVLSSLEGAYCKIIADGLLYHDMKPQNIMLDSDGSVPIIDVGGFNDELTVGFAPPEVSARFSLMEPLSEMSHEMKLKAAAFYIATTTASILLGGTFSPTSVNEPWVR